MNSQKEKIKIVMMLGCLLCGSALIYAVRQDRFWAEGAWLERAPVLSALRHEYIKNKRSSQVAQLNYDTPSFDELAMILNDVAHFHLYDAQKYINYYISVIEAYPYMTDAHQMLGYLYYYQGKHDEAMASFQNAERSPENMWAKYNLGVMYFKEKNFERAAYYLQATIQSSPEQYIAYVRRSRVYRQILQSPQANIDFQNQFDRNMAQAMYLLGLTLKHLGQAEQAELVVSKATAWASSRGVTLEQVNVPLVAF